ncbi:MAG TPA: BON domain-containing protein [Thermoanaerobaculia bacterium]|nr:BON domain-containing protein [Thermoanaerobaculia bacterium]
MRTSKSLLQPLALLCALGLPMLGAIGLAGCSREDETEIKTPEGEVEVETERDASGQTEKVEVDDDRDRDGANLGDDLEDSGITAKVATRLASDDRVKAFNLDVETQKGVVTLTGNVDGDEAKAAAEELARSVDGVQNVVNRIAVGGGEASAT